MLNLCEDKYTTMADLALEDFQFRDDVHVIAVNGWERVSPGFEMWCTIFIKYEEDCFEDDSRAACFSVVFNKQGEIEDVSASCDGESIEKTKTC